MQEIRMRKTVITFLTMFFTVTIVLGLISIVDHISVFGLKLLKCCINNELIDNGIAYHFYGNNYILSFEIFKIPKFIMFFVIIVHFVVALIAIIVNFVWNYGTYVILVMLLLRGIGEIFKEFYTDNSVQFAGGGEEAKRT